MKRIVIKTSILCKSTWNIIYRFIEHCYGRLAFTNDDFNELESVANVSIDWNPRNVDICTSDGFVKLDYGDYSALDCEWLFNIIYDKPDEREDFADIIPFFLLKAKYAKYITLGIDLDRIKTQSAINKLVFKYSIFLFFVGDKQPALGKHSIYFINENGKPVASTLKYKRIKPDFSKASSNFLPLVRVNKDNYQDSFQIVNNSTGKLTDLNKYISYSIDCNTSEIGIPAFEEWIINVFLKQEDIAESIKNNQELRERYERNLHSAFVGFNELVQNIINHTESKTGLLYVNFTKKEDLYDISAEPPYPYCKIPDIASYNCNQPFLEIGIYDFNDKGIADVSNKCLNHWFGGQTSVYDDALHVGIRHFVDSIKRHKGFYSVETNQQGLCGHNKLCLDSSSASKEGRPILSIDGTFYHVLLPVLPQDTIIAGVDHLEQSDIDNDWDITSVETVLAGSSVRDSINCYVGDLFDTPKERIENFVRDYVDALMKTKGFHDSIATINANSIKCVDAIGIVIVKIYKRLVAACMEKKKELLRVVIIGLSDKVIEDIYEYGPQLVWCKKNTGEDVEIPIILLSGDLRRVHIIAGESDIEFENINNRIKDYPICNGGDFNGKYSSLFSYVEQLYRQAFYVHLSSVLDREIGDNLAGCRQSRSYTQLDSELIVKNYYEADQLFQNSFYVKRIAYHMAGELSVDINKTTCVETGPRRIAIVGYKEYSYMLIEYLKQYLEGLNNEKKDGNEIIEVKSLILADRNADDGECGYVFDSLEKMDNLDELDSMVIVIPINSSFKTHDSITSALNSKYGIERSRCIHWTAILVRDKERSGLSDHEKKFWESIDVQKRIVVSKTYLSIHYLFEKGGEWHHTLDGLFFPDDWKKEEAVNPTNNSSLNSKYIISTPKMGIPAYFDKSRNDGRLEEFFKPYTCYGHIVNGANHQKYYFKTNEIIRDYKDRIEEWLDEIRPRVEANVCYIIVSLKGEEDLAYIVNSRCYNGGAEIFTVDTGVSRFNVQEKFKYLRGRFEGRKLSISFVSHVLLTAEAFHQAQNILSTILSDQFHGIDNIFTLQCRLYYDKYRELEKQETKIHSYTYLLVPPSSTDLNCHCSICDCEDQYEKILSHSAIYECKERIGGEINKMRLIPVDELTSRKVDTIEERDIRQWSRMMAKHDVFYVLSKKENSELETKLDLLFANITGDAQCRLDRKISLLKVLSLPELSQFVPVRYYIHKRLIDELSVLFNIDEPCWENLTLLKVILKQMSLLGMNALVRKEVIVNSWLLYFKVRLRYPDKFLNCKFDFGTDIHFFIKNAIYENEARSMWLGELLRTGSEMRYAVSGDLSISDTILGNSMFSKPIDIEHNTLFGKPDNQIKQYNDIQKAMNEEYMAFVSRLFYDNTTIIRKTLATIESNAVYSWNAPYEKKNGYLKEALESVHKSKCYLNCILSNSEQTGTNSFLDNAKNLLCQFQSLLSADKSLIVIKHKDKNIDLFDILMDDDGLNGDYDSLAQADNVFYKKIFEYPVYDVPIRLCEDLSGYGEHSIAIADIEPARKEVCLHLKEDEDNSVIVIFLFKDNDPKYSRFRIQIQERCRLMLLLIPELQEYVKRLHNEGVLNVWLEKEKNIKMYQKTNFTSNHKLDLGRWDFDKLDEVNYPLIWKGMYMLSNVVVSHMYSLLYANGSLSGMSKGPTTLKNVFSRKFTSLLKEINDNKWASTLRDVEEVQKDIRIPMNANILQLFIIQLIDNAYLKYTDPLKQIEIKFNDDGFSITNNIVNVDKSKLARDKEYFDAKYNLEQIDRHIKENDIVSYGMTLVPFIKYCQVVGGSCETCFTIGEKPNFTITFKK